MDHVVDTIINEDGTSFEPPINPLMKKWLTLYPPTPVPEYSQVCDIYSCIFCSRCPYGADWKVPEEDREEYAAWVQEHNNYMLLHNPSLRKEKEKDD